MMTKTILWLGLEAFIAPIMCRPMPVPPPAG